LKAAASSAPDLMRIVRLNKSVDGYYKKLTKYLIGPTLGKGATSIVKLGKNEETGQEVAIKILTGGNFKQEDLKKEIDILKKLDHRNVIKLYDCYENVDYPGTSNKGVPTTVIILELATKGELFDFFMYTGKFEAPLARWFFKQMAEGLDYCHKKGISHRDLKPENCLLGDGYVVKLVDFGFATHFKAEEGEGASFKMMTALGTPGYAAPEIMLRQKYTKAVDIFSLGVILFITIAGFPPFQEAKVDDWWFDKLKKRKYGLFWKAHARTAQFSDSIKELLIGMLAANPTDRWTMKKIKESTWWSEETLTQEVAVKRLLTRKRKVEHERIIKDAAAIPQEKVRDPSESLIRAPIIGTYRPPNAFYCVPSVNANFIRSTISDKILEHFMGKVEKIYEITGTSLAPEEAPQFNDDDDEVKTEQPPWQPWYDLAFTCTMKSEETNQPYEFKGYCYIREDPSYTAPPENPHFRRHVVWFKKISGKVHKWWQILYMLQMSVGFFHSQDGQTPKVSPMLLGPPPTDLEEDEVKVAA